MKKQVKILSIVLMVIMIIATVSNVVFADVSLDIKDLGKGSAPETESIITLGKTVVATMQTIGVVVAVVVMLILGIKYMMGSAEEKAEYKKTMVPYVVGAVLIFAATTIVNVIYNLANGLNN